MVEPVRLSRERWASLAAYMASMQYHPDVGNVAASKSIELYRPIESDGVIFLPAEYVPAESSRTLWDIAPPPHRVISEGEQSAIRAHEYLYGPTRTLGRA